MCRLYDFSKESSCPHVALVIQMEMGYVENYGILLSNQHGGLMVSVLNSKSSSLGWSPGLALCCVLG